MPAINMASSYEQTPVSNPSDGNTVLMNPFSGPKGSPFDNDQNASATTPTFTGTGNGTISAPTVGVATKTESWAVVCTDATTPGSEVWSVTGSVSGAQADATTGVAYTSGGSEIGFTITAGGTNFAVADEFDFLTYTQGQLSTGALCTGIGFGSNYVMNSGATTPEFNDDYTPGVTMPDGTTAATKAILTCIGGGKSTAAVNGIAPTVPYDVQPLLAFGNGISRDAGSGPAYTGHATKTVTATGTVANGSDVEAGFKNAAGVTIVSGQSVFGSNTAASAAVT